MQIEELTDDFVKESLADFLGQTKMEIVHILDDLLPYPSKQVLIGDGQLRYNFRVSFGFGFPAIEYAKPRNRLLKWFRKDNAISVAKAYPKVYQFSMIPDDENGKKYYLPRISSDLSREDMIKIAKKFLDEFLYTSSNSVSVGKIIEDRLEDETQTQTQD